MTWSAVPDGLDVRNLRYADLAVARRLYVTVRDRDWEPVPAVPMFAEVETLPDGFTVQCAARHRSGDLDFAWDGRIAVSASRGLTFEIAGRSDREILYNRIGMCVLHPWREYVRRQFVAETPAGEIRGTLPDLVGVQRYEEGVHVPLFPSFRSLEVSLPGDLRARFEFEGDLFEMEDERNWGDATFKTYPTPLALGGPHRLRAGEELRPRVTVTGAGAEGLEARSEPPRLTVGEPLGTPLPPIGTALGGEPLSETALDQLRELGPHHLRADIDVGAANRHERLSVATQDSRRVGAPLELALYLREDDDVDGLADELAGAAVAWVLVIEGLRGQPLPRETASAAAIARVRAALAGPPVAGGTDLYFCEVNRAGRDADVGDAVFWSLNPQMHLSDDVSVLESPDVHGEQVRAARAFVPHRPLVVSPITLRERRRDRDGVPVRPTTGDPRQALRLAAAWTVASAKSLAEAGAGALTYFDAVGPAGVIQDGRPVPACAARAARG